MEDINHRFTKEVLTRTFVSHDLAISARNLLHDRDESIDIRQNIQEARVTEFVKTMLDILDKEEQSVQVDDIHAYQIKEYLTILDLIMEVGLLHFPDINNRGKITVISQPGLRYAQAEALVSGLLLDEKFNVLSAAQRSRILDRILGEIKGRMMEDIVLLETKLANPEKQVFQLQFAVGEFDMVVYDPAALTCEIFEIKHSREVAEDQYRHLVNTEKCAETEHRFGRIVGRYVIYRGEEAVVNGIQHLNVEEYLKRL